MHRIFNDIIVTLFFMLIGLSVLNLLDAFRVPVLSFLGVVIGLPLASLPMLRRFLKMGIPGVFDFTIAYRGSKTAKTAGSHEPAENSKYAKALLLILLCLLGVAISLVKIAVLTASWIEQALKLRGPLGIFTPMNVPLVVVISFFLYILSYNYTSSLGHSIDTGRSRSDLSSEAVISELKNLKDDLNSADYSYIHPIKMLSRSSQVEDDGSCTITVRHVAQDNSWVITVKAVNTAEYFNGIKNGLYILEPGEYFLNGNRFTFNPYFTETDYENDKNLVKSTATDMQKITLMKKLTVDGMLSWNNIDRLNPRDLFAKEISPDNSEIDDSEIDGSGNDGSGNYELSYKKSSTDSEQYLVLRVMKSDIDGDADYRLISISRGFKNGTGYASFIIDIPDISYE